MSRVVGLAAIVLLAAGCGGGGLRHGGRVVLAHTLVRQLVEDRQGRIVVVGGRLAGPADPEPSHAALVRLKRDGALDGSFGTRGVAITAAADEWDYAAPARDGGLAVAGYRPVGTADAEDVYVGRFDGRGRRVRRFGGGVVRLPAPRGCHTSPTGVAIDAHDRVLVSVVQACEPGAEGSLAVFRFRRDGSLDRTFGRGGRAVAIAGPLLLSVLYAYPAPLRRDANGRLVIASLLANGRLAVVRLLPDGRRDPRFASGDVAALRISTARHTDSEGGGVYTPIFRTLLGRYVVAGCLDSRGPFFVRLETDGAFYPRADPAVAAYGGAFGGPCAAFAQLRRRDYELVAAGEVLVHLHRAGALDVAHESVRLPGESGHAFGGPRHVLLPLDDGSVVVTSDTRRGVVLARYR